MSYDAETRIHIDIVERGVEVALKRTVDELHRRLEHCDALLSGHRRRGRSIEAAACAIRAQALREAVAVMRGNALGALRAFARDGRYSAEARADRPTASSSPEQRDT